MAEYAEKRKNRVNKNQTNQHFLCQHLSFTALPPPHPTFALHRKEISGWIITGINTSGPSEGFFSPLLLFLIFFQTFPPLERVFWTVSLQVPPQLATSKPAGRWGGSYGHFYFNLPPSSSPPSTMLSLLLWLFLVKNLFICLHPHLFWSFAHIYELYKSGGWGGLWLTWDWLNIWNGWHQKLHLSSRNQSKM